MTIAQEIIETLDLYEETPQEINNGLCSDFADSISYGESLWGDDVCPMLWSTRVIFLKDWFTHFAIGHCFIKYNNRYYDSECPYGVDYPDELPYYQRQIARLYK